MIIVIKDMLQYFINKLVTFLVISSFFEFRIDDLFSRCHYFIFVNIFLFEIFTFDFL